MAKKSKTEVMVIQQMRNVFRIFGVFALFSFVTPTWSATLTPAADSYVAGGSNANTNYGTASTMRVRTSTTAANNHDSYIKFDLASLSGTISSARLRVRARLPLSGTVTTTYYTVSDNTWSETGINWNNRPPLGTALGSSAVSGTTSVWYEVDVTNYVQTQKAGGNNLVSFGLHNAANTSLYIIIDSREATASNRPQLVVNLAPTTSITAPANGASFTLGNVIPITAQAADSDGTVSQVQILAGTTVLATLTTAPYTYNWTPAAAGPYSLTSRATDNSGAVTTSSTVNITVQVPNSPPTTSISNPASGASFTLGNAVPITALATDSDGTVSQVQILAGTTVLATLTAAPYTYSWTPSAAGPYSLTSRATDSSGAVTTSAAVNITVQAINVPPTTSITAPTSGSLFTTGNPISITAQAADSDGAVSQVQILEGSNVLATLTAAPYSYSWAPVAAGSYSLTSRVTDNSGAVTTSAPVGITVQQAEVSQTVEYVYDDLDRLVGVITDTGASARYVYDQLGNVTAVERSGAGAIKLIDFSPRSGPVGSLITLRGTGFSTTVSQNSVSFNGISASVVSATATQLAVTVPAAATTGRIAVTTPSGTSTSDTDFTVTSSVGLPTITSFTPTIGTVGTSVTISGTNFDTRVGASRIVFHQSLAGITSITGTAIVTQVPPAASTGRIRVMTAAGTAISSADFVAPPAGINAADITAVQRLVPGEPAQTLAVTTAYKTGVLVFDGSMNSYYSIDIPSFTVSPASSSVAWWLYDTRNIRIATGNVSAAGTIHLPALPQTGTYALYFVPGPVTYTLSASLIANQTVVSDGPSLNGGFVFGGQSQRLTFTGAVGQNLGLGISSLTLSPAGSNYAQLYVYRPDGTYLTNTICYVSSGGCSLNFTNLPDAGTYSIVVTPIQGGTGSFTATLSNDLAGTLTPGTAVSVNLARAGQNGRLTFNGTAGETYGLTLSSVVITGATTSGTATILKPDGTTLPSGTISFSNGQVAILDIPTLPATGTYSLVLDPPYAATASMSVLLTADVLVPLNLDGAASNVTIAQTGQTARLTFTGAVGQNLGLGISSLSLTGSTYANISVYRPNGTQLTYNTCFVSTGGCSFNLSNLPEAGTYSVVVTPYLGGTGSFTATLSSDVTATLTSGTAINVNLARAGQNGRLTFNGTAGQNFVLNVMAFSTTPSAQTATVTVYRPDGAVFTSFSASTTFYGGFKHLASLPADGTYTVLIDPANHTTANMQVILDVGSTLSAGGSGVGKSMSTAGRVGVYTFTGTAGQNLGLGLYNLTLSPAGSVYASVTVNRPNGTQLAFNTCYTNTSGCSLNLINLPESGTYTVTVAPYLGGTGSVTAMLSSEITGTLNTGSAYNLNISRRGQNARLSFNATAGTNRTLTFASITTNPSQAVSFIVYRPNGTQFTAALGSSGTVNLNLNNLPESGTYTLFVDPQYAQTATVSITLN